MAEVALSKGWQMPFVNVFKTHGVGSTWAKSAKQGDVDQYMDKTLRATVMRITGSIPASNYIALPKVKSQSLGLVGSFLHIQFRAVPSKIFIMHFDVVADDGVVVRVSISNLFKEFKATSTCLQFPYVESSALWTVLVLDLQAILTLYVNRRFTYLKGIRLCANMFVRNIFTSSTCYSPETLPKDALLFVPKGELWESLYEYVHFPQVEAAQAKQPVTVTNHPNTATTKTVSTAELTSAHTVHAHALKAATEERETHKQPAAHGRTMLSVARHAPPIGNAPPIITGSVLKIMVLIIEISIVLTESRLSLLRPPFLQLASTSLQRIISLHSRDI